MRFVYVILILYLFLIIGSSCNKMVYEQVEHDLTGIDSIFPEKGAHYLEYFSGNPTTLIRKHRKTRQILVIQYNKEGELKHKYIIDKLISPDAKGGYNVYCDKTGNIYINVIERRGWHEDYYLTKINENAEFEWRKRINIPAENRFKISFTKENDILIKNKSKPILVKLNQEGEVKWAYHYKDKKRDIHRDYGSPIGRYKTDTKDYHIFSYAIPFQKENPREEIRASRLSSAITFIDKKNGEIIRRIKIDSFYLKNVQVINENKLMLLGGGEVF